VLFVVGAMADETALVTHGEFSYINTKGNTDTSSLAFEGNVKKGWDLNLFRAHADAYQSEDDGQESKNKWSVELNYDYEFAPHISVNYLFGYKEDRFSGYDYQVYTGPGIGVNVLKGKEHTLDLQANMLYAVDKPEKEAKDNYLSTKIGAIYAWQIQENLKFIQEATYRINLEQTGHWFAYSKSAIETKINSIFSMGVSYKVDYVNTPPPPSVQSDRTFLVSFIVDY
jgi:putative salt-induced outer membrane protein